jgi:hypothetical protein
MIIKQKAALAGLVVALLPIPACGPKALLQPGPGNHYGKEDGRVFSVYIYADTSQPGQCLADLSVATLWKSKHHSVKWISDDGAAYTVDFTLGQHGSPFAQPTFSVPTNGEVPSGPLTQNPAYYDYGIKDANGNLCKQPSDPGFYVKP